MPSFAGAHELAGLLGLGRNMAGGALLFTGPQLFLQGQSGSWLDRNVQKLPGTVPNPKNDFGRNVGRRLLNELQYTGNQLGKGQIPYFPVQQAPVNPPTINPSTVNPPTINPSTVNPPTVVNPSTPPAPVTTTPEVPGQQAGNAGAMQEYMALKAKAKTPEDYQVLDELGMRIHQEKYGTPEQRKAETIGTFNPLLAQMGLPQPAQAAINVNPSAAFGNQMPGVNVSPYSGAYVPPVTNVPQLNPTNPSYGYQGIPSLGDQTNIGLPEDQKDKAQEFLRRLSKFGGGTK